ncbi:MAG: hypothetical protein H7Z37_09085 [Pyrinomonadaceae bacterium]|nr:hypothetical protein [Pyrinomonadaceae bacterium]
MNESEINDETQTTNLTFETFAKLVIERLDRIELRLNKIESRFDKIEAKVDEGFEQMRMKFVHYDVMFDRLQSAMLRALSVSLDARADVRLIHEETFIRARNSVSKDRMREAELSS